MELLDVLVCEIVDVTLQFVQYCTVLAKHRFVVICTVESAPFVVSMYRPHFRSAPFLVSEKEKWGRCPQPPKTDSLLRGCLCSMRHRTRGLAGHEPTADKYFNVL